MTVVTGPTADPGPDQLRGSVPTVPEATKALRAALNVPP
jgi:hypothetical protein